MLALVFVIICLYLWIVKLSKDLKIQQKKIDAIKLQIDLFNLHSQFNEKYKERENKLKDI
jgi:hypothetical protein